MSFFSQQNKYADRGEEFINLLTENFEAENLKADTFESGIFNIRNKDRQKL